MVLFEYLMEFFFDCFEDYVGVCFDFKFEWIFGVWELIFDGLVVEWGDVEIDDVIVVQVLVTAVF